MLNIFEPLHMADIIHPEERVARREIQNTSLMDWTARCVGSLHNRLSTQAEASMRSYIVTSASAPRVHRLYQTALHRLQCQQAWPLYITFGYDLTAEVSGSQTDGYTIQLSSACVDELTDGELLALLGQQLGHIACGHVQNLEVMRALDSFAQSLHTLGTFAGKKLWSCFAAWMEVSYFSADRAALCACGSLADTVSLLLKQMGVQPDSVSLAELMADPIQRDAAPKGITFIWMMQSVPVYGGMMRIQELVNWVLSSDFRKDYPAMHYCARVECSDAPSGNQDAQWLTLHRQAMEDDAQACFTLAAQYLSSSGQLPSSIAAGIELLQRAARLGHGKAMFTLAQCMELQLGGLKKSPDMQTHLIRAAASRGEAPAMKQASALPPQISRDALVRRVAESCLAPAILRSLHGRSLPEHLHQLVIHQFWMDADEHVIACDVHTAPDGTLHGLALGRYGLYGRIPGEAHPYHIPWAAFAREDLTSQPLEDGRYLHVGSRPVIRHLDPLNGTMGEVLIRLKRQLTAAT